MSTKQSLQKTAQPAARKKSTRSSPDQYTKPELREQIKQRVMRGSKGGNPGQWSARKAQLVASEYEHEGGGYKHPRDEAQQHLHEWTEEHWKTSDGLPAKRGSTTTRYLPEKAWDKLSPEQKRATNAKKVEGSRKGKQFVPNTGPAVAARQSAQVRTGSKVTAASGELRKKTKQPVPKK